MAGRTAAEILRSAGEYEPAIALREFVGRSFTITGFKGVPGMKGEEFAVIQAVDDQANEVEIKAGNHVLNKLRALEDEGLLPLEVIGTSFKTQTGYVGYGIDVVD